MKKLPLTLLLGVLAGCAVGPEYQAPEVNTPQEGTIFASEEQQAVTSLSGWWETFEDPLLSKYVTQGLEASPTLESAVARLRAARAQREGAEGAYYPQVTANGSYTWSRSWGENNSDGWDDRISAGVDAAWELDIFGSVTHRVTQAVAAEEKLFYTLQEVRVSLAAEIAMAYVNVRRYQEQLRIAEASLVLQRRTAEITEKRAKAGTITQYDLATALAQLARVESQLPAGRQRLQEAMLRLDMLLGELPYATRAELETSEDKLVIGAPPKTLANELLRRRADIRIAEASIKQQNAALGSATTNIYPKFRISGNVGVSSPSLTPWDDYTRSIGFGPSVSWNLFGFGTWRKDILAAEESLKATIAEYKDTVLKAYQEAESAWIACHHEAEKIAPLKLTEQHTLHAYEIAMKLYKAGEEDVGDVLSQESNLLTTQENLAVNRYTLISNTITLYKALGGGWSEE